MQQGRDFLAVNSSVVICPNHSCCEALLEMWEIQGSVVAEALQDIIH